jgi:hypothetical protein
MGKVYGVAGETKWEILMANKKLARWQNDPSLGGTVSGRSHLANSDKVFDRVTALNPPHKSDALPILLEDEVPKDLFFPVEPAEVLEAIRKFPAADIAGLTHVWMRRPKSSEFRNGRIPLAEYVSVDAFRLIAIYPWPASMTIPLIKKPGDTVMNRYKKWAPELISHKGKWLLRWQHDQVREFFMHELLQHEVALHAANERKIKTDLSRADRVVLQNQYANQRYFEGNLTIF